MTNYFITATHGAGIKVHVHPFESFPRISERAISVAPGNEAFVAIQEHRHSNLPKPYSKVDCVADEGPYQPKYGQMKPQQNYNIETCLLDCMLHETFSCNCSVVEPPYCTLIHYFTCAKERLFDYVTKCDCQYPCKYTEYETQLSTLSLPTPSYISQATEWNLTHTTIDAIRENAIVLKVYFPNLQITKVKQFKAYSAFELISNLGGQLGLFLGASLISLGELLEFMLQICFFRLKRLLNLVKQTNGSVHAFSEQENIDSSYEKASNTKQK